MGQHSSIWTAEEDQLLRDAAGLFGCENHIKIFKHVSGMLQEGRTFRQMVNRLRYVFEDGADAHVSRNAAGLTKKEAVAILR